MVGLPQAREAGLPSIEPGVGDPADRLDISKPETLQRYHAQMKKTASPSGNDVAAVRRNAGYLRKLLE